MLPASGVECGAGGDYTGCPVTTDLITSAMRWRAANPQVPEPVCRCAGAYSSPSYAEDRSAVQSGFQGLPGYDAVAVHLTRTPGGPETMILQFQRQADGTWLVFDTNCAGQPQNRLSAGAPQTCP